MAATLLKNLGVPARDAQIILGHSLLAVTLESYTTGIARPSAKRFAASARRWGALPRHS